MKQWVLILSVLVESTAFAQGIANDPSKAAELAPAANITIGVGSPAAPVAAKPTVPHPMNPEDSAVLKKKMNAEMPLSVSSPAARNVRMRMESAKGVMTPEDTATQAQIDADQKILDQNRAAMRPVCRMPTSTGFGIETSVMPLCSSLTPEQIKAAPYIDTGETNITVKDEIPKFRYAMKAAERKKLEQQNAAIHEKWDNIQ